MILIDDREKQDVVVPIQTYLSKNKIDSEVVRLAIGDYHVITDNGLYVIVEHKRVTDLINSIKSGHLIEQCDRMLGQSQHVRLFISGVVTHVPADYHYLDVGSIKTYSNNSFDVVSRMDARRLTATLATLQQCGVTIDWWPLHGRVGEYLRHIKTYYERVEHASTLVRERSMYLRRDEGIVDAIERMCIPGVGRKVALNIAQQFPTLRQLATAEVTELIAVKGVGGKLGQAIYDFFNKESKEEKKLNKEKKKVG